MKLKTILVVLATLYFVSNDHVGLALVGIILLLMVTKNGK